MYEARVDGVISPVVQVVNSDHDMERRDTGAVIVARAELYALPMRLVELWPESGLSDGLVSHVVREALESDLALGDVPEQWSPLGNLDFAHFGRLLANANLAAFGTEDATIRTIGPSARKAPVVEFALGEQILSRMAYDREAFAMVVSSGATEIEVVNLDPDEVEPFEDSEPDELMVWRYYTGPNSWVRDAVTKAVKGVHRLRITTYEVGIVVGRAVKVAAKLMNHPLHDVFAAQRLAGAERRKPDVAAACPNLRESTKLITGPLVVAVHGTMSTSLALAGEAKVRANGKDIDVRRFEHDTWLPIAQNAKELVELLVSIQAQQILFLAHSRGGLVARHALKLLANHHPGITATALTLGTPHRGTPLVDGAKVAFLGIQVLIGGLRWSGLPVVDVVTRLAGLAIRTDPPQGLLDMQQRGGYISGIEDDDVLSIRMFAGAIRDSGTDAHGFLRGFSHELLGPDLHDLVVPTASATNGMPPTPPAVIIVKSDHFKYLENKDVIEAIEAELTALPVSVPDKQSELQRIAPKVTLPVEQDAVEAPPANGGDTLNW